MTVFEKFLRCLSYTGPSFTLSIQAACWTQLWFWICDRTRNRTQAACTEGQHGVHYTNTTHWIPYFRHMNFHTDNIEHFLMGLFCLSSDRGRMNILIDDLFHTYWTFKLFPNYVHDWTFSTTKTARNAHPSTTLHSFVRESEILSHSISATHLQCIFDDIMFWGPLRSCPWEAILMSQKMLAHCAVMEYSPGEHKAVPDGVCKWDPTITLERYHSHNVDGTTSCHFSDPTIFTLCKEKRECHY